MAGCGADNQNNANWSTSEWMTFPECSRVIHHRHLPRLRNSTPALINAFIQFDYCQTLKDSFVEYSLIRSENKF
jgi:hypothetical protein